MDMVQGFGNVLKWVKEMKDIEEELNDKLKFLGEFEAAFRDEIHTDILVKPGNNGPPIPAHRALLVCHLLICINFVFIYKAKTFLLSSSTTQSMSTHHSKYASAFCYSHHPTLFF